MDINEQLRRYKNELHQVRIENESRVEDAKLTAKRNFRRDYRQYLSVMSDMFIEECEENFISKDSNFFDLLRTFDCLANDLVRDGYLSNSALHTARLKELINDIEQSNK
tara:strand:+ start:196 stop:522 length:327 start_codon:yes stop_codon:yes gene_type:complete